MQLTLLCLYERHFPPHKRIARKVEAVKESVLQLYQGTGAQVDEDMADWVCRNWDLAMLIGEFGYDSAEVRARLGQK